MVTLKFHGTQNEFLDAVEGSVHGSVRLEATPMDTPALDSAVLVRCADGTDTVATVEDVYRHGNLNAVYVTV